jgi:transforming growth factor-beta-induced protein
MKSSLIRGLIFSGTVALLSSSVAFAENPMVGGAPMSETMDIIDNAVNSADHTTLVAAVKAAGLVDTLKGAGPFTVLAPTNDAFAALPAGTVETLLKPENKDMLVKILTCHVIAAKALSTDITSMAMADGGTHVVDTVGGCKLSLKSEGGTVTITDETGGVATVTIADVVQSNGVIHVIDKVLLPKTDDAMAAPMADAPMAEEPMGDMAMAESDLPMVGGAAMYPTMNIIENAVNSADHTTLVAAVKAAGLVDALSGPGPFTVFAPTNDAFDLLPAGTVDSLLKPEAKDTLTKVLTAHVVAGKLSAADLMKKAKAMGGRYNMQTLSGDALTAVLRGKHVYIFDESGGAALVTIADVNQSNGVIHVINKVLLPK